MNRKLNANPKNDKIGRKIKKVIIVEKNDWSNLNIIQKNSIPRRIKKIVYIGDPKNPLINDCRSPSILYFLSIELGFAAEKEKTKTKSSKIFLPLE